MSGINAVRNAIKLVRVRPETFGLAGCHYWLIGKQNDAVKWWKTATEEGEQLAVLSDLSRAYLEIGSRFLEEKSRHNVLKGISAERYLEKARTMFKEMNLQWNLDELDKIVGSSLAIQEGNFLIFVNRLIVESKMGAVALGDRKIQPYKELL